tara:strand:- start:2717 stop:3058 length:342 start_codon:yes stop_codon:yes gene_type:complete
MKDVTQLIDEILAVDDVMPSTQEDLEDFKRDLTEGELTKDDREYIIALHERLISGGVPAPNESDEEEEDSEPDEPDALETEVAELKTLLAERDDRITQLERQLEEAQGGEPEK